LSSGRAGFAVFVCVLAASRAFIDYSTSGLENPLTYFLTASFFLIYIKGNEGPQKLFFMSLITSFGFLNRPDLVLIFAPALVLEMWENRSVKSVFAAAAGLVPFLVWEVFSVIYYGFPLPNTFYAKLSGGIPRLAFLGQGVSYFINSLVLDPATLATITAGIMASFLNRGKMRAAAAGVILYLVYVVYNGGDFMSGRFLTPALFTGALMLASAGFPENGKAWKTAALASLFLCFLSPYYGALRDATDPKFRNEQETGIADERMFFYGETTLKRALKEKSSDISHRSFGADGLMLKKYGNGGRTVTKNLAIGMVGFYAGPNAYIIDLASLANAYTARLPAEKRWRPGHIARTEPEGYFESVKDGGNKIKEPEKALLYDRITLITKGPLYARGRWDAIRAVNF
ncbi:MAG: hypothetical protein LLG37_00305, partial [Spirochaetia bacterium]|nr:hypothetical protein [Spirochaetia bacterium]